MSFSFDYHVDLAETWRDLQKALEQIAPGQALLSELLGKVLIYHISVGIHHNTGALSNEQKAEELRTFLTATPDLNPGESAEAIMRDIKDGVLFSEVAALSEELLSKIVAYVRIRGRTICVTAFPKCIHRQIAMEYSENLP